MCVGCLAGRRHASAEGVGGSTRRPDEPYCKVVGLLSSEETTALCGIGI